MQEIISEIKFDEKGLVPVVTQDCRTDEVLMVAYMNQEALRNTIETGTVHYWSRSRNSLWLKGETSGHFQKVRSVSYDCDGDTLLLKVEQKGAACHTGHHSCFYRKIDMEGIAGGAENTTSEKTGNPEAAELGTKPQDDDRSGILQELYNTIADRKANPKEGSYTNYLFEKGLDKILKKVGEEAAEVLIASKNTTKPEVCGEISDLMYHLFVLMVEKGIRLDDIYEELKKRH